MDGTDLKIETGPPTYGSDTLAARQFLLRDHTVLAQQSALRASLDARLANPSLSVEVRDEIYRRYLQDSLNLLLRSAKEMDIVPPASVSFSRQHFWGESVPEFGNRIVSSCVLTSTLNAVTAMGIPIINSEEAERDALAYLNQLPSGTITYRPESGNFGLFTATNVADFLRTADQYNFNVRGKTTDLDPVTVYLGLAQGRTYVYGPENHAMAIVGMSFQGKEPRLLIVDPLHSEPKPNEYSFEEFITGKDGMLPSLSLRGTATGVELIRTDANAVNMQAPIRLAQQIK